MSAPNRFLKLLALLLTLALLALAQGVSDKTKPAKEYVHLNGRVVATRVCPSCPTIKLTDNTHAGTTHYRVGDNFTVTVKGPANSPVTVGTYTFGSTDGNGNWSISNSWGFPDVGSYTQYWAVGGIPAMPMLIFTVYAN